MSAPARVSTRTALSSGAFWIHFVQMVVAMVLGMLVLGMLWPHTSSVEPMLLIMATNMAVGMAVWMFWKRHRVVAVVEMSAAMYASFVVLFPFLWLGWLSADGAMMLGHVLMLPAMLGAMLWRPSEYACA